MQVRVDWVLIIFGTQIIRKKWRVRSVFPYYLSYDYDQTDSKNECLLLSASFTAKFWLVFVLTLENTCFLRGLVLKPTERAKVLLKSGTRDF